MTPLILHHNISAHSIWDKQWFILYNCHTANFLIVFHSSHRWNSVRSKNFSAWDMQHITYVSRSGLSIRVYYIVNSSLLCSGNPQSITWSLNHPHNIDSSLTCRQWVINPLEGSARPSSLSLRACFVYLIRRTVCSNSLLTACSLDCADRREIMWNERVEPAALYLYRASDNARKISLEREREIWVKSRSDIILTHVAHLTFTSLLFHFRNLNIPGLELH